MDKEKSMAIINYVVSTTEPLWRNFINLNYADLDKIFLQSAYEQGGFAATAFYYLLEEEGIASIEDLGQILNNYDGEIKYSRPEKGSLKSPFYQGLKADAYREKGKIFYTCVDRFLSEKRGNPGGFFWAKLWQMLICCKHLKQNYHSSFKYYLKKRHLDYKGIPQILDTDFCNISNSDWEVFKKDTNPWDELYGIGENVFDYLVRNIKEFKFSRDSFKLDSANTLFFKRTGISSLFDNRINDREAVIKFLTELKTKYTLREINTGTYSYCSWTERKNFGFCRNGNKCDKCEVNSICDKNFKK